MVTCCSRGETVDGGCDAMDAKRNVMCATLVPASDLDVCCHRHSSNTQLQRAVAAGRACVRACISSVVHPDRIGVSFNGGKDSVVMLELLIDEAGVDMVSKMRIFMIGEDDEFEEVRRYRESYLKSRLGDRDGLLTTVPPTTGGIRQGLAMLKAQYNLEAVFLGVRRDDPSAKYQKSSMEPTTSGWPELMRYSPTYEFLYHDVWQYCHDRGIAVCELYGKGYTSLGGKGTTKPNQALAVKDSDGNATQYRPAWLLEHASMERDGRQRAHATAPAAADASVSSGLPHL